VFDFLGRFALAQRKAILVTAGLVLLVAIGVIARGGELSSGETRGTEADLGRRAIDRELQLPGLSSFAIVFQSDTLYADDPEFVAAMGRALAPLRSDPRVAAVKSADDAPDAVAARFRSEDGHHALAVVLLRDTYHDAAIQYPELRAKVHGGPLKLTFTGYLAFRNDLDKTLEHDLVLAELVSLPLTLIILLLVFRTLVAATLPAFVGGLAVLCGMAGVTALSRVMDVPAYAINVASLIGLGVAIDYSLFLVTRYRDELAAGRSYDEALLIATNTAGRAVAFSGLAVGIGLAGLVFLHGSFLAPMGLAGAIVVAFAVVFALTCLPALLAVLGPRIHAGRVPFARVGASGGDGWQRLARWVMARPLLVLAPVVAVLLVASAPFFHMRMQTADVSVLPKSAEARRGYDLMVAHFPDHVATRVNVVVEFPARPGASGPHASALDPRRARALYDLSQRAQRIPGVRAVESIVDLGPMFDRESTVAAASTPYDQLSPELQFIHDATIGPTTVALSVLVDAAPASDVARGVVRTLRQRRDVADGRLRVTGQTAEDLDVSRFIEARAPWAVGFVVLMTYFVLFALLRSVLLPLKAVVMNFLSIGASFGALVWIFQDGHFASLFGFEPAPIDPTLPVLLFCTVFGLSMDYEVLMLTRMHEEYERTRDNTQAVADGLEQTAGLITSAASVMVAVFAAFALATVLAMKAMGVALALAVTVDATLVRVLIVPATMRLFGDLNWWCPQFLLRWLGPAKSH